MSEWLTEKERHRKQIEERISLKEIQTQMHGTSDGLSGCDRDFLELAILYLETLSTELLHINAKVLEDTRSYRCAMQEISRDTAKWAAEMEKTEELPTFPEPNMAGKPTAE